MPKPCYDNSRARNIDKTSSFCTNKWWGVQRLCFTIFRIPQFLLRCLCNKLAFQANEWAKRTGQQPLSARLRRQHSLSLRHRANVHLNYLRLNSMRQMTQTICWRCHYSSDFINHSTIVFRCLETCASDNNYAIHLSRQANRTQTHLRHSSKSRRAVCFGETFGIELSSTRSKAHFPNKHSSSSTTMEITGIQANLLHNNHSGNSFIFCNTQCVFLMHEFHHDFFAANDENWGNFFTRIRCQKREHATEKKINNNTRSFSV